MARPKHRTKPGGTYFITTDTYQRRRIFQVSQAAEILKRILIAHRDKGAYSLHRYVIMPDHVHFLLTPGSTTSLEKAVQLIKGGSSHEINKSLLRRFPVWRPGFTEHLIRDQADYDEHVRYIDDNPVEAGLTDRPEAYPFAAANGEYRLDPWPVASGAKARETRDGLAAGLKPRPSTTHRRDGTEAPGFIPAGTEKENKRSNP